MFLKFGRTIVNTEAIAFAVPIENGYEVHTIGDGKFVLSNSDCDGFFKNTPSIEEYRKTLIAEMARANSNLVMPK